MKYLGIAILGASLAVTGCQTAKRKSTEVVKVYVTPSKADIKTSLGHKCKSPCSLTVKRKKRFTVTASANGYKTQTVKVDRVLNKKAAAKSAASFVVPGGSALVAVDTLSGSLFDHTPNPVRIRLKRK